MLIKSLICNCDTSSFVADDNIFKWLVIKHINLAFDNFYIIQEDWHDVYFDYSYFGNIKNVWDYSLWYIEHILKIK